MTTSTKTPAKPQTVTLDMTEPKQHSVRFDSSAPRDERPAARTLYLSNEAYEALGSPDSITVTITAA